MPYGRMSADSIAYLGYPPALPSFPAITLPTADSHRARSYDSQSYFMFLFLITAYV
jgi:hypothetical protein